MNESQLGFLTWLIMMMLIFSAPIIFGLDIITLFYLQLCKRIYTPYMDITIENFLKGRMR